MPDEQGKLSPQELATAKEWVQKNALIACVCGTIAWDVANHVVVQRADAKNLFETHSYFPSLMLICRACGHYRFYGIQSAGITPRTTSGKEVKDAK